MRVRDRLKATTVLLVALSMLAITVPASADDATDSENDVARASETAASSEQFVPSDDLEADRRLSAILKPYMAPPDDDSSAAYRNAYRLYATGDCGIITCTLYFNRGETAFIAGLGGVAPACGLLAAPWGLVCAAVIGLYGGTASYAYARDGCLKVKWLVSDRAITWPDTHYGDRCT